MGQHVEIIAIYRDADIIARFPVRQLRVAVLVLFGREIVAHCD